MAMNPTRYGQQEGERDNVDETLVTWPSGKALNRQPVRFHSRSSMKK